jgi:hypothetical protein
MSELSSFFQSIRHALRPTDRGVDGLVDDLLALCQGQGIELDWHAGRCRVRTIGIEPEGDIEMPLPRPVFRAALARIASLRNERKPGAVSPYGGQGELMVGADRSTLYRATFTNTQDAQQLQLTPVNCDDRAGDQENLQHRAVVSDPRLGAPASR